jgi:two-component system, LytTR family, sensor kinase
MVFDKLFLKIIPNYWLRCNAQYFIVGILIGTFVNIIFRIAGGFSMSLADTATAYVVSIIITLCITNIHLISSSIIKVKFTSPAVNMLLNYLLIFIGIVIGTELSILCIALIYDIPFQDIDQVKNLKRNLGLGLLAGTLLYIYQLQQTNYNLKIHEKELQVAKLNELKTVAELKTLQARINPHFLYNALNSITSLIHESPDKAEEMIIKLSQLFRYSINTQEVNWVTIHEELEITNNYLDIERVRFSNRIAFETKAEDKILNVMIPRFLLQPLVENALKHGLKSRGEGGLLRINITGNDNTVHIEVHDNGEPFPADMLSGYGLQSTSDKLQLLYGNSFSMNFVNAPEKMIVIELPKNNPS